MRISGLSFEVFRLRLFLITIPPPKVSPRQFIVLRHLTLSELHSS
jgi:hypothetical protein